MTAELPTTGEITLTNLAEKLHMPLDKTAAWLNYHGIVHVKGGRKYSLNAIAIVRAWQSPPARLIYRGIEYNETVESARKRTTLTDNAIRGAIQRGVIRAIKIRDWPMMVVSADVDKYVEAHR